MIEEKYPTFIVAGGVRCATGWIRECLSEHPDIYMQEKETHFFDQNYEKGGNWYCNFFNVSENSQIIGEKTASYLHIENAAKNIKELIPDVKLVFCLRDPIERMHSHYFMSASFDKKLEENGILNSIETVPKFLEWGKYSEQLSRFLFLFPRKNMLIKIYEDIEKDPFKFISEIYSFVGADQNFKAPSTKLRTKLGQLEHNSVFWGQLAKILLHPRAPRILSSVYTSIRPINQVQISDEIYSSFASYYRDDIIRLEEILGRDLNIWRTKGSLN